MTHEELEERIESLTILVGHQQESLRALADVANRYRKDIMQLNRDRLQDKIINGAAMIALFEMLANKRIINSLDLSKRIDGNILSEQKKLEELGIDWASIMPQLATAAATLTSEQQSVKKKVKGKAKQSVIDLQEYKKNDD